MVILSFKFKIRLNFSPQQQNSRIFHLQLFPQQGLVFTCLQCKSFENTVEEGEIAGNKKTLWEKEKLLIMSNLSFSHSVFYPFGELSAIFIKFRIVICKLFQFGRDKNLSFGIGLRHLADKKLNGAEMLISIFARKNTIWERQKMLVTTFSNGLTLFQGH